MSPLPLDSEQTIYQVATTHEQLSAALLAGQPLVLDLSTIEECDTSFVQLLLWLQAKCREKQQPLALGDPSPRLAALLAQLGLADALTFGRAE
ncbi:STAS domain-containing protein [Chitinilyticum litopenaei]|uniref:STAS domain-containing protein n=1 Tax=Chitinilyticum litopenaei TaxID=1121276 RepID=UPI0003FC345A|nr:STAS domain-containing protein [Chitinilyticum litopenaei]